MAAQIDPNTPTTGTETEGPALEELQAQVKKREGENAGLRGEITKREKRIQELETAQLTEQEKVLKERDDLKAQLAERDQRLADVMLQQETLRAAAKLGFNDPGDAFRFLDRGEIQTDSNGNPTNLDVLLAKLAESKPYLTTKVVAMSGGTSNPGPRIPTEGRMDMNDLMRAKLANGR